MNQHVYPPVGTIAPRQAELLAFIDETLSQKKRFPSPAEMAQHMGWKNEGSVFDCLDRLVWRGYLEREKVEMKGVRTRRFVYRRAQMEAAQ